MPDFSKSEAVVDRFAAEVRDVVLRLIVSDAEDASIRKAAQEVRARFIKDHEDLIEVVNFLDLLIQWYLPYRAKVRSSTEAIEGGTGNESSREI